MFHASPLAEHLIQRSRPMTILRKEIGRADRCHARTKGSVAQAVGMRAVFVCLHIGLAAADIDWGGSMEADTSPACPLLDRCIATSTSLAVPSACLASTTRLRLPAS